ncbi:MAG TPA: hypothetical protein VFV52_02560 [Bacilli bacterium]|nr:hypothetical protein [Bacilli bacterium]
MNKQVEKRWELDTLFPGGAASEAFAAFLQGLDADLARAWEAAQGMQAPQRGQDTNLFREGVLVLADLEARVTEAESFATSLVRQNTVDGAASRLQRRCVQLAHRLNSLYIETDRLLVATPEDVLHDVLADERIGAGAYTLWERRTIAEQRLAPEVEQLVTDLAGNGVKSWAHVRHRLAARLQVTLEMDGQERTIGGRQAFHLLFTSQADGMARRALPELVREAVAPDAELYALALGQILQLRVQTAKLRGVDDPLQERLVEHRLSERTLTAMEETLLANVGRMESTSARRRSWGWNGWRRRICWRR